MLLNMHFQKYRSNFENYTYVLWKGSRTKIKHKKRSEMFACNRIFMSSLLCLVFYGRVVLGTGEESIVITESSSGSCVVHVTNNSPCARHSPRLIAVEKFLSTPASSPRPILCGLYFHLFAFFIFMDRTFTGQIYCIRIKWWDLLFNKSRYGPQFVQSHIGHLHCCVVAQQTELRQCCKNWGSAV